MSVIRVEIYFSIDDRKIIVDDIIIEISRVAQFYAKLTVHFKININLGFDCL